MKKFEVLCVTMNQNDFSKISEMNIDSDVVFANQCDETSFKEYDFGKYHAKMISTQTRGVGLNRNIAISYADAEICLMADDDMVYRAGYAEAILKEFERLPQADVIIFNIGTSTPEFGRIPTVVSKSKRLGFFSKCPFGAPRIAFRLDSIKKTNIGFSAFFGGGAIYSSGEDSIWLSQLLNAGVKIYLSDKFIGDVSYSSTTWNEDISLKERLYTRGAMYEAGRKKFKYLFMIYYAFMKNNGEISALKALKIIKDGKNGYKCLKTYKMYDRD